MSQATGPESQTAKAQFSLRSMFIVTLCVAALCGPCKLIYDAVRPHLAFYTLEGPKSPTGMRVFVDVHDNTPGISTCFLADVRVVDSSGVKRASWLDPNGQYSPEGVKRMIASMEWTDDSTLRFMALYLLDTEEVVIKVRPPVAGLLRDRGSLDK